MTDSHRWQREVIVELQRLSNSDLLVQRFMDLPTARRRDLASMVPRARMFVLSVESAVERRYLCGMDKEALLRVIALKPDEQRAFFQIPLEGGGVDTNIAGADSPARYHFVMEATEQQRELFVALPPASGDVAGVLGSSIGQMTVRDQSCAYKEAYTAAVAASHHALHVLRLRAGGDDTSVTFCHHNDTAELLGGDSASSKKSTDDVELCTNHSMMRTALQAMTHCIPLAAHPRRPPPPPRPAFLAHVNARGDNRRDTIHAMLLGSADTLVRRAQAQASAAALLARSGGRTSLCDAVDTAREGLLTLDPIARSLCDVPAASAAAARQELVADATALTRAGHNAQDNVDDSNCDLSVPSLACVRTPWISARPIVLEANNVYSSRLQLGEQLHSLRLGACGAWERMVERVFGACEPTDTASTHKSRTSNCAYSTDAVEACLAVAQATTRMLDGARLNRDISCDKIVLDDVQLVREALKLVPQLSLSVNTPSSHSLLQNDRHIQRTGHTHAHAAEVARCAWLGTSTEDMAEQISPASHNSSGIDNIPNPSDGISRLNSKSTGIVSPRAAFANAVAAGAVPVAVQAAHVSSDLWRTISAGRQRMSYTQRQPNQAKVLYDACSAAVAAVEALSSSRAMLCWQLAHVTEHQGVPSLDGRAALLVACNILCESLAEVARGTSRAAHHAAVQWRREQDLAAKITGNVAFGRTKTHLRRDHLWQTVVTEWRAAADAASRTSTAVHRLYSAERQNESLVEGGALGAPGTQPYSFDVAKRGQGVRYGVALARDDGFMRPVSASVRHRKPRPSVTDPAADVELELLLKPRATQRTRTRPTLCQRSGAQARVRPRLPQGTTDPKLLANMQLEQDKIEDKFFTSALLRELAPNERAHVLHMQRNRRRAAAAAARGAAAAAAAAVTAWREATAAGVSVLDAIAVHPLRAHRWKQHKRRSFQRRQTVQQKRYQQWKNNYVRQPQELSTDAAVELHFCAAPATVAARLPPKAAAVPHASLCPEHVVHCVPARVFARPEGVNTVGIGLSYGATEACDRTEAHLMHSHRQCRELWLQARTLKHEQVQRKLDAYKQEEARRRQAALNFLASSGSADGGVLTASSPAARAAAAAAAAALAGAAAASACSANADAAYTAAKCTPCAKRAERAAADSRAVVAVAQRCGERRRERCARARARQSRAQNNSSLVATARRANCLIERARLAAI